MAIFTVPADFKVSTLDNISLNNSQYEIPVAESYGSLRNSLIGSGRKYFELPEVTTDGLRAYIRKCNDTGITFNYTLNLACFSNNEFTQKGKEELIDSIGKLVDCGVSQFTVAMPSIIELLDAYFSNIKITLSVITGVDSLSKMKAFSRLKNINSIYIHEKIYRQLNLLKGITHIAHDNGIKVGVIVNSFCLSDCPYRCYHYNFGAHATAGSEYIIPEYYGSRCALMKIADKRNVLTAPWIRPDDIDRYIDCGVDKFKISGREMHTNGADIERVVQTYNSRKYDGNLADLFMCFTQCAYSEIFNIKNDKNLDNYLSRVLGGVISCNVGGCSDCMQCKEALLSIAVNREGADKWSKIFYDRIRVFRK